MRMRDSNLLSLTATCCSQQRGNYYIYMISFNENLSIDNKLYISLE